MREYARRTDMWVLKAVLFLLICVLLVVSFLLLDRLVLHPNQEEAQGSATEQWEKMHTVYLNGEAYLPRKNQTNLLIIGLDVEGKMTSSNSYNNSQQSDFLVVVSFDHDKKTYSFLHINRDTMADVDVLSLTGQKVGKSRMQLALAHTYGDGLARSCVNTVDAISYFLYGAPIHHYFCMTMGAVSTLNDAAGGVTITLGADQDYTEIDASLVPGATVTLDGELAMSFVRARMDVGDGSNVARMQRQKLYLTALIEAIAEEKKAWNDMKMLELYDEIAPYTLQDGGVSSLEDIFDWVGEYSFDGIYMPEGQAVEGEKYMEFYVDDQALQAMVAKLYFEKKS